MPQKELQYLIFPSINQMMKQRARQTWRQNPLAGFPQGRVASERHLTSFFRRKFFMMGSGDKLKVLIIDDNELTRAMLRMIIQGDRYDVVGEAGNGATGIERALILSPDVICLDVVMPDYDGLAVLAQLKQKLPETAMLMVTASNDIKTVEAAVGQGADGFIVKPFNTGTVLDTLENIAMKFREKKKSKLS